MHRRSRPSTAGVIAILLLSGCGGELTDESAAASQGVAVTVQPDFALVAPGRSYVFQASVTGTGNTTVAWSLQEGAAAGQITSAGSYVAPTAPGSYHVVATSVADPTKSAVATVSVSTSPGHLLYTDAAMINRPISYWRDQTGYPLSVDSVATSQVRAAIAGSSTWFTTHVVAFPVYFVKDGDSGLVERVITRGSANWVCPMDQGVRTTVRMPSNAHADTAPGFHDRHLAVVDTSRNRVYSFYGSDDTFGVQANGSMNTLTAGCDLYRGDDAVILQKEAARWTCTEPQATSSCGTRGIGTGIDIGGASTNAGFSAAAGVVMPEDFSRPEDLGHALQCVLPTGVTDGWTWPAKLWQGTISGMRVRNGSILRINPSWQIPATVPAWEAKVLRTWQRYGCIMADGANAPAVAMHGQADWAGPGGTNPWAGVLPATAISSSGAVILRNFPIDQVEVLEPNGPVWGLH